MGWPVSQPKTAGWLAAREIELIWRASALSDRQQRISPWAFLAERVFNPKLFADGLVRMEHMKMEMARGIEEMVSNFVVDGFV
jgi:hypothetical protein